MPPMSAPSSGRVRRPGATEEIADRDGREASRTGSEDRPRMRHCSPVESSAWPASVMAGPVDSSSDGDLPFQRASGALADSERCAEGQTPGSCR